MTEDSSLDMSSHRTKPGKKGDMIRRTLIRRTLIRLTWIRLTWIRLTL